MKKVVGLTGQRLPGCCGLRGSGAGVSKVAEFGRSFCMLVLNMVRNGAIADRIFHALCSRMILDGVGSILSV